MGNFHWLKKIVDFPLLILKGSYHWTCLLIFQPGASQMDGKGFLLVSRSRGQAPTGRAPGAGFCFAGLASAYRTHHVQVDILETGDLFAGRVKPEGLSHSTGDDWGRKRKA